MYQLFEKYFPNVVQLKQEFLQSTWETLYMVLDSIDCWCVRSLVGCRACQYWPQWCFEKSTCIVS